ncbi:MAG: DUF5916 domain-containing protein [Vicinamibacterales bacterium]
MWPPGPGVSGVAAARPGCWRGCLPARPGTRYAVTQHLVADLTVNTDFAQVEVDEPQVNLTRFNLSFLEKRDLLLEGAGTFASG